LQKKFSFCALLVFIAMAACGGQAINLQPTQTSAPFTLPPTWTPSLVPTAIPTFTEISTLTPVPALSPLAFPTNDMLGQFRTRFPEQFISPNGAWVAYRGQKGIKVVNAEVTRTWTLPCELFEVCSALFPVKWSHNGQFLYFAPVDSESNPPSGISLFTAAAMINVRSGKWEMLLPDSDHYYDFTFSPDEDYLAYVQSSGKLPGQPSVTVGFIRMKNKKGEQFKLDEMYGGNIVWSPFKPRFVFQTWEESGSSIVYFDMEIGVLKYVISDEQNDFLLDSWEENNLVSLQKTDRMTHLKSNWELNPFTGEMSPAPKATSTP
jgi:hypothetical protein